MVVREWPIPKNQRSYTLYGLTEATLDSLFLSILPSEKSEYIPLKEDQFTETLDLKLHILLTLIQALKMNAKFNIEAVSIYIYICIHTAHIILLGFISDIL